MRTVEFRRGMLLLCLPVFLLLTPTAMAHTEVGHVAVPAGESATVTLRPTHGCGGSPTVAMAARIPVADATAGHVAGWTVTSEVDDQGRTVVEWSDGLLPADRPGEFPVVLTVPDGVGTLLVIPFIQICENGEELAWIDGDPSGAYPAPRLLILSAGSDPAATLDDVPADAPGRDLLTESIDVDNPNVSPGPTSTTVTSTTPSAPSTTVSTIGSTTTIPVAAEPPAGSGGGSLVLWAAAGLGLAILAVALWRRRANHDG